VAPPVPGGRHDGSPGRATSRLARARKGHPESPGIPPTPRVIRPDGAQRGIRLIVCALPTQAVRNPPARTPLGNEVPQVADVDIRCTGWNSWLPGWQKVQTKR
jgi:hypothetical protein